MMPSKFKLIVYYDTNYTSPFLVKIGSPVMCFHPSLNITPFIFFQNTQKKTPPPPPPPPVLWILSTKSLWNNKKMKCSHYTTSCATSCSTTTYILSFIQ
jgi:hypothetical protein